MNYDFLYVVGFFVVLLGPGIYFTWKGRINGKFRIIQLAEDKFELQYGYQCEWIHDSMHATLTEAEDKAISYCTKRATRPLLMP